MCVSGAGVGDVDCPVSGHTPDQGSAVRGPPATGPTHLLPHHQAVWPAVVSTGAALRPEGIQVWCGAALHDFPHRKLLLT